MHAERLRPLLSSHGPYGSVYFDDSHDTEDAAAQIDLKWRDLQERLEQQGAEPALTEALQRAVVDGRPEVGRGGRAIIAGSGGVLVNEHLPWTAGNPEVRVGDLPYLLPVVEHGTDQPTYLIVRVDHEGGDITVHRRGVDKESHVDHGAYPVHKAAGAETSGYGDPQRPTEEARRKNLRAVADRVTELTDETHPEVVFVIGEVRSRSDFTATLPERVAERAVELHVGARHTRVDDREIRDAVAEEFARRRDAAADDAAQRFTAELGRDSGLATEGLAGVCAALRAGAVETLIIGELGESTVMSGADLGTVAPNENVLSELGTAPTRTLRADEALPMVALSTGATLVVAGDRVSPADGVGAILRYSPR